MRRSHVGYDADDPHAVKGYDEDDDERFDEEGEFVGETHADWTYRDPEGWWPSPNILFTRRWPACFRPSFKCVWQCLVCNASGPWSPTTRRARDGFFVVEALSYDDIAQQTGWNRSTLRRAEEYLRSVHLIERRATSYVGAKKKMTNVYVVQPNLRAARWDLAACGWKGGQCDHSMVARPVERAPGDHKPVLMKSTGRTAVRL